MVNGNGNPAKGPFYSKYNHLDAWIYLRRNEEGKIFTINGYIPSTKSWRSIGGTINPSYISPLQNNLFETLEDACNPENRRALSEILEQLNQLVELKIQGKNSKKSINQQAENVYEQASNFLYNQCSNECFEAFSKLLLLYLPEFYTDQNSPTQKYGISSESSLENISEID